MAENERGKKYPLLLYRLIARRYRPFSVLLIVVGLLAFVPLLISQLKPPANFFITYEQVMIFGGMLIGVGIILFILTILEGRRAYVQCLPDYLLIRTAYARVAIAYQRINTYKNVLVADLFPLKQQKGRDRILIKPLRTLTALELVINEYPLPEADLRRRLHRFFISPRDTAFVLIIPTPGNLRMEIMAFTDRAREAEAAVREAALF